MAKDKSDKNWFARHKFLTVVIVVIAIGVFASALGGDDQATKVGQSATTTGTTDTKKVEKTVFKPGDKIAFDGKEVIVAVPERNWNSGNQFIAPQSGNEFVKVQVTLTNNSDSEAMYNTFDWKLQDSKGVIKDVATAAFGVDGALDSGSLAPGGTVSGFLVFEVPAGDKELTLRYSPSFWSNKKVEVKL